MATVVTITVYLPDGTAANRHWEITTAAADELAARLGPPGGESMQTGAELDAMAGHMATPVVDWTAR